MRVYLTFIIAFLTVTRFALGTIVIEHTGANDPTTEGWTLSDDSGGSIIHGPVYDDLGYMDAWRIDAYTNDATSNDLLYRRVLSEAKLNDAVTRGWVLTSQIRLIEATGEGLNLRFASGTKIYDLYLAGSPANADPTVTLMGDPRSSTLLGGGGAYHSFRMADEDANGLADVFIDGQLVFADYAGNASQYQGQVQFGDWHSQRKGHALYAQVGFEILPEPSTALLLATASLFVLRRRRRTS
ncbi:MAG: PEP-CTERM sorting domain-containing protein [Phycisphaerae bacterium]|nr:PEP-CTERM sorting domain-containing protein [Phycisphaerae bacterium]